MEIKENSLKRKCDFGACRNTAKFCIAFNSLGAAANIDICPDCLAALYKEAKRVIYDKKSK